MAASRGIGKFVVYEILLSMARELEYTARLAARAINGGDPSLYSNVRRSSDNVVRTYYSLLDYLAEGRMSMIENSSIMLDAALSMARAAQRIEASLYRYSLVAEKAPSDVIEALRSLASLAGEAASVLSSQAHLLASGGEALRPSLEKFNEIVRLEGEADAAYRRGLKALLEGGEPGLLLLAKDALDYMEDGVDAIYEASGYLRVLVAGEGR